MSLSRSASVSVLPDEVLSHIFQLGLLSQEDRGNSPWNFSFRGCCNYQLTVSHVSRHFRNVAIHTPRLWSLIYSRGPLESQLTYIKTCLERSRSLLCFIFLNYDEHEFDYPNPDMCEIMTLVNLNIYRLERFLARSPQIPILHQIMGYLNKPAPRLTTLELSYTPGVPSDNLSARHDFQYLLFGGKMPMLTTILLEGASALRWPGYNLENITEIGLSFEGVSMHQELRTLIKRTPLLRKLGLRGSSNLTWTRQTEVDPVIKLNFLEYLEMAFLELTDAIDIVSLIHAPTLKTLILSQMGNIDYSTLLNAISRQPLRFPSLASLLLGAFEASNEAVAELLHVCPNLEWLGIYEWDIYLKEEQGYVHVLEGTKSTGSLPLCPNLKTLRCDCVYWEHIQDVLARRAEANIPLPKVELSDNVTRTSIYQKSSALSWLQQNTQVEFVSIALDDY